SPVGLEKPERIAALAMLTVVGLLVYAVIQRQVRLYLRDHEQHLPGNTGPTATPPAAVVFALFTPVTLVHFAVDNTPSLQVHGVQDYHRIICDAVGIDQAWSQGRPQSKIHHRGPHSLERGVYWAYTRSTRRRRPGGSGDPSHRRSASSCSGNLVRLGTRSP